ncbi:Sporulation membrane protein YtrH [Paenibacillus konkukensis]|uniref:Sporulation membrane protein YtrH n=1 Tax=Paenibacillus konkukensis TaxID=2020716 RepID=A0ABY4RKW4_9BACL|nr:YtrH family sporulation protein [Paenibacillus konkukensis]UQZ83142.1 Sporulation membrane protein YtrH [Paenibacillus konkukensis]
MVSFMTKCVMDFFIAFGVVLGGTMLGGIAAVLTMEPPTTRMLLISEQIKIWALVAAVGGTIDPLRFIESNLAEGFISPAIKQILLIVFAFIGAQSGTALIQWICREGGVH